jgi:hypothetical protein
MSFGRPFQRPSTSGDAVTQQANLYQKLVELRHVCLREQISAGGTVTPEAFNTVLQALAGITSDKGGRRR